MAGSTAALSVLGWFSVLALLPHSKKVLVWNLCGGCLGPFCVELACFYMLMWVSFHTTIHAS